MGKIFDLDSPLVRVLNKIADLMWLNILTIIFSIPIVTFGASLTAAHYVALKILRNEEGYIAREFLKSFKTNFKQATVVWLIALLAIIILIADFVIMRTNPELEIGYWVEVLLMVTGILLAFTLAWIFPLMSKFTNTLKATLKNALALGMIKFPRSIVMVICYVLPVVMGIFFIQTFPFVLLFGLSFPVFVSALLYNKIFKGLEEKIIARLEAEKGPEEENPQEDERIFRDVPENEGE
ncbi:MAG: DUF624 domain-containing protein [Lachnospiraceae bacterium]|nr:DUF624 domain-containing protein [Lachnospiraceae bacterium]